MKIESFLYDYWVDIPQDINPAMKPAPRDPCVMVYRTLPSFKTQTEAFAVVVIPSTGGPIIKASAYDVETAGIIAAAIARSEGKEVQHGLS